MQASSSEPEQPEDQLIWSTLEAVLRPKFRFGSGAVEDFEEAEYREALSEAYANVKRRLQDLEAGPIRDLEGFTAIVARNVFKGVLKRKYPVRYRLALELRSTLNLDPRLAYWIVRRLAIAGKTEWEGKSPRVDGNAALAIEDPLKAAAACFASRDPSTLPPPDLLLRFFDWIQSPFGFDPMVLFCFRALGLKELDVSAPDPTHPEPVDLRHTPQEMAAGRSLAQFIWEQCAGLEPVRRGVFLLFEPSGENQEAICDQLLLNGVCSLTELAQAVGLTFEQFCELRRQGRITYETVATLYSLNAKQAENIRRGVTDLLWRRLVANGYQSEAGK